MKWHCKVLVFSLILMTSWCTSHAQSTNKKLAYAFLNDGKYLQACEYFTEYLQHHPADKAIQMQLAIALYHTRRIKEATQYIDQLLATSGRVKQEEAFLYKAYLLHDAQEFSAAVKFYKKYLQLGKCSTEKRSRIKQRILNCATGIQLSYKSNAGSIQELPSLNTAFDEYLPVPSPNYDDLVYFSSNRLGNWDIFSATFSNNALESKNTVTSLTLNTPKAEQLLDFDA
ncbi:MAG: tetratricopeptide repeat protein, partial [Bacteroidota bacterium]